MSAPKNYSIPQLVTKADDAEIADILKKYPLWKLKDARALVARRNFARRMVQLKEAA